MPDKYPEWIEVTRPPGRFAARLTAKRIVLVAEVRGHWGGTEEVEQAYHQKPEYAAWERYGFNRHGYHFPALLAYGEDWTASPALADRLTEAKRREERAAWQGRGRRLEARARHEAAASVHQAVRDLAIAARGGDNQALLAAGVALREADARPWQRFVEPDAVINMNARMPEGFEPYVVPAVVWKCNVCFMPAASGKLNTRHEPCDVTVTHTGKLCTGRLVVPS